MPNTPPPWFGYEQVPDAPYPMTAEGWAEWPKEPGYKYELHDGMLVRKKRDPAVQRFIDRLAGALGEYAEEHGGQVIITAPEEEKKGSD